jgi:glycogen(starch) synthase
MHILLTTDTVGGVWTFTEELSAGLIRLGHQVTLVTLGHPVDPGQRRWLASIKSKSKSPLFRCIETTFRLEWMEDATEDLERSSELLRDLVRKLEPDVLHSNQFAYGDLSDIVPVLLTGHSDMLSWWEAVHGERLSDTGRMRAYTTMVRAGLASATRLAAPTAWMARELREQYAVDRTVEVLPNGRSPELFLPGAPKRLQALTVGRAWDPGKHVSLLEQLDVPMLLLVAGPAELAGPQETDPRNTRSDDIDTEMRGNARYLGRLDAAQLQQLYAETAIYIATSTYEPFGLAPLEAALSGCALVLSDLPGLREIWGGAAEFYPARDASALQELLCELAEQPERVTNLGARALARAETRYTASSMVQQHVGMYQAMMPVPVGAPVPTVAI